ncbi:SPOR domain-containing protein [Bradyrhizobium sp. U87765 SZCCT0131]|nr:MULTISPECIES: SPOR domain-containing protein [unclassified Bradyrhizobium]MBR1216558.1 SPOR domain-containing protein [Bradyrhizobium sp. U87765 SZCCT0131]MBR1259686.1 SPOR domain-containing protein [Bradyrhizobium sp. U87765 SZCCT0134]
MWSLVGRRLAVAALVAIASPAHAATIEVNSLGADRPSLITISGTIETADRDTFLRKIVPVTNAIVAFDSDGGNLIAGLQIGETIRMKNFATLVPDQARCASSCALAWLGGTRRLMGPRAQVGFHAAYDGQTGKVTSGGNALVGAYLNKIGLPYKAVLYITSPPPESVTWLSNADAEKLGIEVSLFSPEGNPSPTRSVQSDPLQQPPPQRARGRQSMPEPPPERYGVQVTSQRSEADARAAYRILQSTYPSLLAARSPLMIRADTGEHGIYYRAVIGPFDTATAASDFCTQLKTAGGMCAVQRISIDAGRKASQQEQKSPQQQQGSAAPPTSLIFPTSISPKYASENRPEALMHTCLDQYIANKATNSNGGLKWIERGGGYYSTCATRLRN